MNDRHDMNTQIGALLDGELTDDAAIDYLSQMDMLRINAQQLAGAVDAVMARANPFPAFPDAVDCCGTGGDGRLTYNISTAAAFVAAANGVMIAKHGNRAISSKSGSADVLAELGVNTNMTAEKTAEVLEKIGICFLYAPNFHPSFARVASIRNSIGKRTIFNLLGPLCNPARVKRQLIGVFAPEYCNVFAEAAQLLGHTNVMVVHGEDGTDEISITGNTHVAHLADGAIRYSSIHPDDAGLPVHPGRALVGGDATQNARAMRDVLGGLDSPYADAVMFNTAGILMVAGKATSLLEGAEMARGSIARVGARRKLSAFVEASMQP